MTFFQFFDFSDFFRHIFGDFLLRASNFVGSPRDEKNIFEKKISVFEKNILCLKHIQKSSETHHGARRTVQLKFWGDIITVWGDIITIWGDIITGGYTDFPAPHCSTVGKLSQTSSNANPVSKETPLLLSFRDHSCALSPNISLFTDLLSFQIFASENRKSDP